VTAACCAIAASAGCSSAAGNGGAADAESQDAASSASWDAMALPSSDGATTADSGANASGRDGGGGGTTDSPAGTPFDAAGVVAPPSKWVNVTSNLAGMASECGNLTMVSAKPKSNLVIAGVARHGLYGSTDGGHTWSALGSGAGSAMIINRPSSVVYDPVHADVFWESGIYNGGGVYQTLDNGVTFKQLGTITHIDLVSIDFTDARRQTLLAGGHEQKQTLYRSTDGGGNWTNVGTNLPAGSHFSSAPLVLDGHTHLVGCCGWGSGTCGIWGTTNGGSSWTQASPLSATDAPLLASSGAIYWSIIWNGGMAKSTDQGRTWAQTVMGTVSTGQPIELPDARLAAVGTDHIVVSKDAVAWTPVGDKFPYTPAGAVYSAQTKTFFIWRNDCNNVVLPDAIMSEGFDYLTQ
jgi:hypothetical protein